MFNIKTRKVELIAPLHTAFSTSSVCVFNNNQYLVKIGGWNSEIKEDNNLFVELYDIKNNKWHEITNIEYSTPFKPVLTFNSGVIQLKNKQNTVFVFGGYEAITYKLSK